MDFILTINMHNLQILFVCVYIVFSILTLLDLDVLPANLVTA